MRRSRSATSRRSTTLPSASSRVPPRLLNSTRVAPVGESAARQFGVAFAPEWAQSSDLDLEARRCRRGFSPATGLWRTQLATGQGLCARTRPERGRALSYARRSQISPEPGRALRPLRPRGKGRAFPRVGPRERFSGLAPDLNPSRRALDTRLPPLAGDLRGRV